jgi:diadenosine tetraphosphate (Ap4A) HIT family hydrolase
MKPYGRPFDVTHGTADSSVKLGPRSRRLVLMVVHMHLIARQAAGQCPLRMLWLVPPQTPNKEAVDATPQHLAAASLRMTAFVSF